MMEDQPTTSSMRRWRILVALLLLGFGLHVMWACGLFKPLGVEGFVSAADVHAISTKLDNAARRTDEVQDRLLKKSIIDTRILQCNAASKRYFTDRLHELTDEYYDLNKRAFDVPTCAELN